jgi:hypothetical protein
MRMLGGALAEAVAEETVRFNTKVLEVGLEALEEVGAAKDCAGKAEEQAVGLLPV